MLLQRQGHFDWQDWAIYAVVVAASLIVMMSYLPHRLDENRPARFDTGPGAQSPGAIAR